MSLYSLWQLCFEGFRFYVTSCRVVVIAMIKIVSCPALIIYFNVFLRIWVNVDVNVVHKGIFLQCVCPTRMFGSRCLRVFQFTRTALASIVIWPCLRLNNGFSLPCRYICCGNSILTPNAFAFVFLYVTSCCVVVVAMIKIVSCPALIIYFTCFRESVQYYSTVHCI